MASDLDDLTTPLTYQEIRDSIYTVIASTGTDHTVWKPGAIMRTFITAVAIVLAGMSRLQASIAAGAYLDRSSGNWLTLLAYFVYGVTRIADTFATGTITLNNTGGGSFSEAAGAVTFTDPSTGKQFRNVEAFTLDPLETGVVVAIRAVESGSESTAIPGAINTITSPAMSGVTCSNAAALIGTDLESDARLRVRCRERLGALSPNGPWDAYSYVAKSAVTSTGQPVAITRVRTEHDGFGNVNAYLATDSGPATGTVGDLATDLGAADEAMQQLATPQAVTLNTFAASSFDVPVVYQLWVYDSLSLTDAQLIAAVNARVTAYFKTLPIGGDRKPSELGKVRRDLIKAVIAGTRPEIFAVEISSLSADPELAANEVPVLSALIGSLVTRVNLESLQ